MNPRQSLILMLLFLCSLITKSFAASPTIDSLNIQSYIRLTNGQPVSNTSGNFVFAVFKGTSCIWAKRYLSVSLNAGVINQKISGLGTSIASINNPNATAGECVANYTSTSLNSNLLMSGGTGTLTVRIYTETSLDGYRPIWDVAIASAPTAFVADQANLATTATVANDLINSKKAAASAGISDSGKVVVLDSGGKIDNTMINQSGLSISSSQVSGLGTAASVNTGTGSGNVPVLNGSGRLTTGVMPTYTANRVLTTDASGNIVSTVSSTNTSSGAGDAGKVALLGGNGKFNNNMIDSTALTPSLANATGTLAVSKGGTGSNTLNSGAILVGNGTNAVNSIPSTTGNVLVGTVSGWNSSTPDSANLVDKTSTQTVSGAKTWNGNQTFNGMMAFGSGGASFSKILRCSLNSDTYTSTSLVDIGCAGATSISIAFCSPDTASSTWSISYASPSNDQLTVRLQQDSGSWTTGFNCVVFVP